MAPQVTCDNGATDSGCAIEHRCSAASARENRMQSSKIAPH
jgi:hypothetical protein